MPDDPPSIYRYPSTPRINDLGTHADAVCRRPCALVGAIIAIVLACKLEPEASALLMQTVAKVLPEQSRNAGCGSAA